MRRLTRRENQIFILTAIFVVIYISYNGIIKPMREEIESVERRIEAKRNQWAKGARIIRKAKILQAENEGVFDKFKQKGTGEEVMSSILSEIEDAAMDLDIRISDLKTQKVKVGEYFNQFSITLSITSQFSDIIHFIYILQREPHYFHIEELNFTKQLRRNLSEITTQLVISKTLIP